MARALYRLGLWCAHHAKGVLVTWIAILLALCGSAAALGNPLTNVVTIPGSDFEQVLDELGTKVPEASGGFGTVVVSSDSRLTASQRAELEAVFADWEEVPEVKRVIDPFEQQERLDEADDQLAAARRKIRAGQTKLDDAWTTISENQGQIDYGKSWIRLLEEEDPDNPRLAEIREQVRVGEPKLEAAKKRWRAQDKKLEQARADYRDAKRQRNLVGDTRFVTTDGRYAIVQVQFDRDVNSVDPTAKEAIQESAEQIEDAGMSVAFSKDITQENSLLGPGEVVGVLVAAVVLFITLGALLAAGMPILGALVGVGVGLAGAMTATYFFDMHAMTPSLAMMLGLAVGIDYSLFIINRHRSQLLGGHNMLGSIGRAVGTAGSAVVVAGTTVVIALVALLVTGIPLLGQMGLVAAATVAVSVLVAITLTPALLAMLGHRVVSRRGWRAAGFERPGEAAPLPDGAILDEEGEEHGAWYARLVTRRPVLSSLAVLAVTLTLALPALDLRLGLPDGSNEPAGSSANTAYVEAAEHFGAGTNGPVIAVATFGEPIAKDRLTHEQVAVAEHLSTVEGVRSIVPFGVSEDRTTLAFQVVPETGPAHAETVETVRALTATAPSVEHEVGATLGLTGQTVANIEISRRLAAALPPYLAIVVGLSILLLMAVFRSVWVPLIATFGFLLSVAAAFGATVAVYQWGWLGGILGVDTPGPILSFMPIMLIGVLFGLAMDYQMFLVSGMKEAHAHGEPAVRAIITGFSHGAKVVTAAAVIMASVFAGFVFAHLTMIRPIGFGLAVGVLVDAVLVRMTLVPALLALLGERAWSFPAWLDRLTPNLDVEGTALTRDAQDGGHGYFSPSTPQTSAP